MTTGGRQQSILEGSRCGEMCGPARGKYCAPGDKSSGGARRAWRQDGLSALPAELLGARASHLNPEAEAKAAGKPGALTSLSSPLQTNWSTKYCGIKSCLPPNGLSSSPIYNVRRTSASVGPWGWADGNREFESRRVDRRLPVLGTVPSHVHPASYLCTYTTALRLRSKSSVLRTASIGRAWQGGWRSRPVGCDTAEWPGLAAS